MQGDTTAVRLPFGFAKKPAKEEAVIFPQCIIGFSHGTWDFQPGPANEDLAGQISSYLEEARRREIRLKPLIVQEGIDLAGADVVISAYRDPKKAGTYLEPYEVACQAYEAMKRHGVRTCAIAAHEHQFALCAKIMTKLGAIVAGKMTTHVYHTASKHVRAADPWLFQPYVLYKTLQYEMMRRI